MVTNLSCYCSIEHGSSWYGEEGDGENLLPTTVMVSSNQGFFPWDIYPGKFPGLFEPVLAQKNPKQPTPNHKPRQKPKLKKPLKQQRKTSQPPPQKPRSYKQLHLSSPFALN